MNLFGFTDEEVKKYFTSINGGITMVPAVSLELLLRLCADASMYRNTNEQLAMISVERDELKEKNEALKSEKEKLEAELESYKASSAYWWKKCTGLAKAQDTAATKEGTNDTV